MKNNFTNTIGELQNFNLEPGKEVWVEIEKQLPQEKKRRIIGWWWGVPVILGLGLMTWFFTENEKKDSILVKSDSKTTKNDSEIAKNEVVIVENNIVPTANMSTPSEKSNVPRKSDILPRKNVSATIVNVNAPSEKGIILRRNDIATHRNGSSRSVNDIAQRKNVSVPEINSLPTNQNSNSSIEGSINTPQDNKVTEQVKNEQAQNVTEVAITKKALSIVKADTTKTPEKKEAIAKQQTKKIDWTVAIGGGTNYLSRNGLFNSSSEKIYVSNITTGTASSPLPQSSSLSLPNTGFNFNIGINGNYALSKKSTVQFGLHYKYLQNNIGLNSNVDSTADMNLTYSLGNSLIYKNTYQLLSVPISYKYCFNPSAKNKISVIVGGTIDYSIAKNWLFVSDAKDYYEKNNSELNNFFASLHTGFSFNINNKFSIDITANKYLNAVQKSSSKYYWQQLNMQVNIPLHQFKK